MAKIIEKVLWAYDILFDELPDSRTKSWFVIAKPLQCLMILALYLMFVLKWGPRFMKNRPPYNIDKILIIYNAIQVICCSCLLIAGIKEIFSLDYKIFCEPVDTSDSKSGLKVAKLCYVYFILKILDLLDTIFFVLRKKHNQVSFLHIYHHAGMVLLVWGTLTYLPGGHGVFIGIINSFVHVLMYSYYLLSVALPNVKESLSFKKFVTQIQILQFFLCVVHMSSVIIIPDCEFPKWTAAVFLPQNVFILVLFLDFYIKTYVKKPKTAPSKKLEEESRKSEVRYNHIEGKGNHASRVIKPDKTESGVIFRTK